MPSRHFLWPFLTAVLLVAHSQSGSTAESTATIVTRDGPIKLDWKTLLPENERQLSRPRVPPAAHDYLSEGDMVALQSGSFEPNRELDGKRVRVPGFVVPLDRDGDGLFSGFLLVPYFGACIHLPPPPPNQVIYVRMRAGKGLKSIDDAVWVTGTLHVDVKKSSMGSATYTLDGEAMELYGP